ncbi:histidine kinase [Nocardia cyriacigeorgica]|uniref:histidine kinase n=1 Tax=Nocardia cyriacigeorgica TaxID=135487 RepID=A0ABX0CSB7_9NOCA|nr:histidine kinase [Nocardia cyriacigeorgica]NEW57165.1 histidine kinase [Nocardia cyriacigeorgica]
MDSGCWANRVHNVREFGMAGRGLVGWDWGVALVVALVQVFGGRGANFGQTGVRSLDALGYALLLVGPVALLFRRYEPLPVLFVTLAACVTYLSLDYGYGPIFLSLVIAFLTAATRGSRWWTYPLVPLGYLAMVWPLPALLGRPTGVWQIFGLMAWLAVLVGIAEGIRQRQSVLEARRQRAEAARRDEEAQRRRQASEERLAIARELHDVLAHSLSLINVQASVALELFDRKPEQAASALAAIKGASKDALAEVHTLLHTIRTGNPVGGEAIDAEPESLSDPTERARRGRRRRARARRRSTEMRRAARRAQATGASTEAAPQRGDKPTSDAEMAPTEPQPAAPRTPAPTIADLDELLHRIREAGLTVHTRVLGTVTPLPSVIDVAAARIIQESLTNVVRHAPGADATVTVRYTPDSVDFTIDNTRPTSAPVRTGTTGGNGIIGMRERAHALGGALTAGPRPSGGFRVAARLPVRAVSAERPEPRRADRDSAAARGSAASAEGINPPAAGGAGAEPASPGTGGSEPSSDARRPNGDGTTGTTMPENSAASHTDNDVESADSSRPEPGGADRGDRTGHAYDPSPGLASAARKAACSDSSSTTVRAGVGGQVHQDAADGHGEAELR